RRVLFRSLRRHASHALRGRVGGDEVGPLLLDPAKIQDQRVELRIRDLGLVEHEVGVLMTPDLVAQSFRPLLNVSSPLAGRSGVSSPLAGRPGVSSPLAGRPGAATAGGRPGSGSGTRAASAHTGAGETRSSDTAGLWRASSRRSRAGAPPPSRWRPGRP